LRLWDVILALKLNPFCYAMHVPFVGNELNVRFFRDEIRRLISTLEESFKVTITDDSIRSSIKIYNKTRELLAKVYELRKKEVPPLSGAEVLGIIVPPRSWSANGSICMGDAQEMIENALKTLTE